MRITTAIREVIFPNRCFVCQKVAEFSYYCCKSCLNSYPLKDRELCYNCGKTKESCICKNITAPIEKIIAPCFYEKAVTKAIKYLKTDTEGYMAANFANLMINAYTDNKGDFSPNFITYIPMERDKEIKRGHNSARSLALIVSNIIEIPLINPPFIKTHSLVYQHDLSRTDRFKNAHSAFKRTSSKIYGNIILIDDVVTTGATINAASHLLKGAGADKILCLSAATTLLTAER